MGALIGLSIISLWLAHLAYLLGNESLSFSTPMSYAHLAIQGYLATGLFITAHDAMHGSASKIRWLNHAIGALASFLFAAMSYERLRENHRKHHEAPASETDPDFHVRSQNFFVWFGSFLWRYKTWTQVATMAAIYNVFERVLNVPESRIWLFWILPCVWGALQLFYFGTYLPHRLPLEPEMSPHNARSQPRNHWRAMLSCYFFGYHWEHHHSPQTPWWKLWKVKDARHQR
ncbi:MAG: fatty acid desaturase [Chloroherpetonaceae bacterium]|nr:fatty acid desaturase [Chloroherpetonaceae bacterium]MDW8437960.1 fatty acid desaturase [Chloroherpetonaceae bacterium]